jgi:hypothetical protein
VDDVFIIYNDNVDGDEFLKSLSNYLYKRGLSINAIKTQNYGKISEISKNDKNSILDVDEWNYEVKSIQNLELEDDNERLEKIYEFEKYLNRNNNWQISDANFVLNSYIDKVYVEMYIRTYWENIICSKFGRGSIFKKMYELVFSNQVLLLKFFRERRYESIPFRSVNLKNYLATILFNINSKYRTLTKNELKAMTKYFICNESNCDDDEISMIFAVAKYMDRIKENL